MTGQWGEQTRVFMAGQATRPTSSAFHGPFKVARGCQIRDAVIKNSPRLNFVSWPLARFPRENRSPLLLQASQPKSEKSYAHRRCEELGGKLALKRIFGFTLYPISLLSDFFSFVLCHFRFAP
ncbi:MAG TPA: hypothetical protein VFJ90_11035 [Candidatus Didemnitutus sp.]|nr:hypothetical protein [Candidatus Didemnitutus sp.]